MYIVQILNSPAKYKIKIKEYLLNVIEVDELSDFFFFLHIKLFNTWTVNRARTSKMRFVSVYMYARQSRNNGIKHFMISYKEVFS